MGVKKNQSTVPECCSEMESEVDDTFSYLKENCLIYKILWKPLSKKLQKNNFQPIKMNQTLETRIFTHLFALKLSGKRGSRNTTRFVNYMFFHFFLE